MMDLDILISAFSINFASIILVGNLQLNKLALLGLLCGTTWPCDYLI